MSTETMYPQQGWACPVCQKGNAPTAMKCGHCADAVFKFTEPGNYVETTDGLGNRSIMRTYAATETSLYATEESG